MLIAGDESLYSYYDIISFVLFVQHVPLFLDPDLFRITSGPDYVSMYDWPAYFRF